MATCWMHCVRSSGVNMGALADAASHWDSWKIFLDLYSITNDMDSSWSEWESEMKEVAVYVLFGKRTFDQVGNGGVLGIVKRCESIVKNQWPVFLTKCRVLMHELQRFYHAAIALEAWQDC
ncbi:hypothetical protein CCR75_007629 [Bremia lactucae]|uniref:Uncharacterized protein n=1 Tax=Bremia lactucae TaxID=4779 RepID=A0A976FMB5_BRELC|nr:hypothetical protein CCR75_007629 [Bremia lactucae]